MAKQQDYVLWDLDGTLTDPMTGITQCVQYALQTFGIQVDDLRQLCCFIGPPLIDSFQEYYGFSEEQALQAVAKYRERFSTVGWRENVVYPGIPALLQRLCRAGVTSMLATSKPEVFARKILAHFGLEDYFSFIGGATLDNSRSRKEEVIRYVLEANALNDLSRVIMVGDRKYDITGAHSAGLRAIGVLYGYGSREELTQAGADVIAANISELEACLL